MWRNVLYTLYAVVYTTYLIAYGLLPWYLNYLHVQRRQTRLFGLLISLGTARRYQHMDLPDYLHLNFILKVPGMPCLA